MAECIDPDIFSHSPCEGFIHTYCVKRSVPLQSHFPGVSHIMAGLKIKYWSHPLLSPSFPYV